MPNSLAGKLLVASPKLTDPNFSRTVIYLCEHNADGAFGLVLNRPLLDVDVAQHLPEWRTLAAEPGVVFAGGPVEPSVAIGLARGTGAIERGHWTPLTRGLGMVNLRTAPHETAVDELRVFIGYSGWGAGQLDGEVKGEDWFVIESEPHDVFTTDPAHAWRDVLRRQRGKLAMFAFHPVDPTVN